MFVEEEPSNPEESESKQAEDKDEETKDFSNSTRDYEEMDEKQLGYEDYLINEQIEGLLDLAISQANIQFPGVDGAEEEKRKQRPRNKKKQWVDIKDYKQEPKKTDETTPKRESHVLNDFLD